ncbi:MAG TPA: hypothetical protein VH307_17600 [Streptosporangiaceae bacterium]|jgi:NADPH:quinone reductase-like Zn-dependent oxidoreductase|nr:hypothetical protein [Streptosporangiaceae bacterium]
MGSTLKAIRYDAYGSPEVLDLRDVEMPAVHDDEVLVRVRAASVNPLDCVRQAVRDGQTSSQRSHDSAGLPPDDGLAR